VTPEPARPRLRGDHLLYGMLALLVATVVPFIVIPALRNREVSPELPDLGEVPAFALTDDAGASFTQEALRNHPTVVDFVFTRCDSICPVVTMKMQRVQEKTGDPKGAAIKMLSISVDPEYDTPARLTEYAKRYGADPMRWRFLTGPADQVRALVEGPFMNSMVREGASPAGAPRISHNGYFLLVDGDLHIRGVYDSNDVQRLDELIHDARYLARTHRSYKFGQ